MVYNILEESIEIHLNPTPTLLDSHVATRHLGGEEGH